MPKGDAKDILANVDCRLAGDKSADQGKQRALEEYYAAVQAYWSRLCRTDLGCWALDSGISEFRMTARMLVDPREALSAIGLSRPAARRAGQEKPGERRFRVTAAAAGPLLARRVRHRILAICSAAPPPKRAGETQA